MNGKKVIFHFNRIVVHPDYQGLGLGISFIDETCRLLLAENPDFRIMGKFSSVPVYKAMIKRKSWVFLGETRLMGKMQHGNIDRKTGFRDGGIKTFSFEWVGP